jgi:hypothetical protein
MGGEILHDPSAAWLVDQEIELILQMAARDGDAVRRHPTGAIAVTDAQRALQHGLHAWGEVRVVLIADERTAPAQQMREMQRLREFAIRRPAVAHKTPAKSSPRTAAASS